MTTNLFLVIGAVLLVLLVIARRIDQRTQRLRQEGLYPREGQETAGDVDRLLQLGHKIEAIKVYRALHGVGLKEAKEAVERRQRELGLR